MAPRGPPRITTAFAAPGLGRSVASGARSAMTAEPLIQTGVASGRVSCASGMAMGKRAASAAGSSDVISAPRSMPWTMVGAAATSAPATRITAFSSACTSVPSSARITIMPASPRLGRKAAPVGCQVKQVDRARASAFDRAAAEEWPMAGMLEGKIAAVTGAGGGIGREIAIAMARAGAKVLINDIGASLAGEGRSATPAEETKQLIEGAGGAAAISTDSVAEWGSAQKIVQAALD